MTAVDAPAWALEATPKQQEFAALLSGRYRFLAMGGGVNSAKTYGMLIGLIMLCKVFPRSRWVVVRKDLPRLRQTTVRSFYAIRETCPRFIGDINQGTWTATCANGSELWFMGEGVEGDKDFNRWKGLEPNGFFLEQAEELSEGAFNWAKQRAGRWHIKPQPPPLVLATFNPCSSWPRDVWYEPHMAGVLGAGGEDAHGPFAPRFYMPVTYLDNPYVTEDEQENWKSLPVAEYKRFVLGDWTVTDAPDQLISYAWIKAAADVEPDAAFEAGDESMGIDVAWEGDDLTVFCRMQGNTLVREPEAHHGIGPVDVAERAITLIRGDKWTPPISASRVWIDGIGMGSGPLNILTKRGYRVRSFIAGGKPIPRRIEGARDEPTAKTRKEQGKRDPEAVLQYRNAKAQAWWELAEKLRAGQIRISKEIQQSPGGQRLIRDLLAIKRRIGTDRFVEILDKATFKRENSRSPDYGDAFAMACYQPSHKHLPWTAEDYAGSILQR